MTGVIPPPDVRADGCDAAEHAETRFLLHAIGQSIGGPAADLEPLRRRFHDVIGEHNEKEEAILYPGTDRMLSPEESDEVVWQIQRYGM